MIDKEEMLAYYMDNNDRLRSLTTSSHPSISWWRGYNGETHFGYSIDGHPVPKSTYDKALELIGNRVTSNTIKLEKDAVTNNIATTLADIANKYAALSITAHNDFAEEKEEKDMNNRNWIHTMPSIKSHKYIKDHGVTIIEFNDGTVTKVVCDPMIADEFTGFCAAIAKRAMGNGDKMLSEWERLVIKPEEDKRKAEEKAKIEAEEEKKRAEIKAKRDAKKAKRKAKRTELKRQKAIEEIAEIFAKDYAETSLYEEAAKLAMEKYGVPKEFFDDKCDCDCKEFDVMDSDDDSISD